MHDVSTGHRVALAKADTSRGYVRTGHCIDFADADTSIHIGHSIKNACSAKSNPKNRNPGTNCTENAADTWRTVSLDAEAPRKCA
eukprot:2755293-Rhodomonas_salina.5